MQIFMEIGKEGGGSQKVSVYIGSASQKNFFDCERFALALRERFALTQFFGEGRVLASRPHYYRGAMMETVC